MDNNTNTSNPAKIMETSTSLVSFQKLQHSPVTSSTDHSDHVEQVETLEPNDCAANVGASHSSSINNMDGDQNIVQKRKTESIFQPSKRKRANGSKTDKTKRFESGSDNVVDSSTVAQMLSPSSASLPVVPFSAPTKTNFVSSPSSTSSSSYNRHTTFNVFNIFIIVITLTNSTWHFKSPIFLFANIISKRFIFSFYVLIISNFILFITAAHHIPTTTSLFLLIFISIRFSICTVVNFTDSILSTTINIANLSFHFDQEPPTLGYSYIFNSSSPNGQMNNAPVVHTTTTNNKSCIKRTWES
ncbi:hypothetical protein HELRODRAFT_171547 [Helobdella robusta]|uniref:Uncharacterized protein n=1 Tax=Helobdella robusta TaxID=6412 RepID=T1F4E3_HELRO|nr:hypothetical protein HELRODRAFT_171547 [Helobdella robusta]ESO05203.1 hypothetical protein HELRODRAFT_171547 [Helobdella robusta]